MFAYQMWYTKFQMYYKTIIIGHFAKNHDIVWIILIFSFPKDIIKYIDYNFSFIPRRQQEYTKNPLNTIFKELYRIIDVWESVTEASHRVNFLAIVKRGHLFTKNTDVTHSRSPCFCWNPTYLPNLSVIITLWHFASLKNVIQITL